MMIMTLSSTALQVERETAAAASLGAAAAGDAHATQQTPQTPRTAQPAAASATRPPPVVEVDTSSVRAPDEWKYNLAILGTLPLKWAREELTRQGPRRLEALKEKKTVERQHVASTIVLLVRLATVDSAERDFPRLQPLLSPCWSFYSAYPVT